MPTERLFLAIGAALALTGVAGGAFGAHALRARLEPALLDVFETAVRYQMFHALGVLVIALLVSRAPAATWAWAGWLFTVGTVIFSGSLYLLALSGARWFGAITPVGGVCLIAGWGFLLWGALRP